jgi:hypothetical protein
MGVVGLSKNAVLVLHVGGSKASHIKLVLHREPRPRKTWFLAGSIMPNEEHVNVAIHEIIGENSLTLTPDDLTMLSNNPDRVSLLDGKHHLVYVFSAYVPIPFVTTKLRIFA